MHQDQHIVFIEYTRGVVEFRLWSLVECPAIALITLVDLKGDWLEATIMERVDAVLGD